MLCKPGFPCGWYIYDAAEYQLFVKPEAAEHIAVGTEKGMDGPIGEHVLAVIPEPVQAGSCQLSGCKMIFGNINSVTCKQIYIAVRITS